MEETEQGVSGISEDYHFSKPPVFQLFAYILTINIRWKTPFTKVPREDPENFSETRLPTESYH